MAEANSVGVMPQSNPFDQFDQANAGNPFDQFDALSDVAAPADSSGVVSAVGGFAKDLGVSYSAGVGSLLSMAGSLYGLATGDMDNAAREIGTRTREYWQSRKSPELLQLEENRKAKVDAADGVLAKAGTAFWETLWSPSLLSSFAFEQAPNLLISGGVGRLAGAAVGSIAARGVATEATKRGLAQPVIDRAVKTIAGKTAQTGATAGALGAGAAMQGADVGANAYDRLMEIPDAVWMLNPEVQSLTGGDATKLSDIKPGIALRLSRNSAAAAAITSLALNRLPGAATLEKTLAGVKLPGSSSRLMAVGKAALGEGAQEAGEEGSGQLFANIAAGSIDPTIPVDEGVGEAIGLGAASFMFGGAAGFRTPLRRETTDEAINRTVEADTVEDAVTELNDTVDFALRTVQPGESLPVEPAGFDRGMEQAERIQPAPAGTGIPGIDFQTKEQADEAQRRTVEFAPPALTTSRLEPAQQSAPGAQIPSVDMQPASRLTLAPDDVLTPALEGAPAAVPAPITLLNSSGEPFRTKKSASLSRTFRDNPGAEIVPVDGGFGVRPVARALSLVDEPPAPTPAAITVQAMEQAAPEQEWVTFPAETGTLNIPRAEMPQIKAEHRGISARGIF